MRGELPLEIQDLEDDITGLDTRMKKLKEEFKASMEFMGIEEYEHWTGYKGGEDY